MCTHRLSALITALLLVLSLSACASPDGTPAGMARASAEFADYDLFVPENWIVTQSGGAVSAYVSESDPTNVSVMSWEMPYIDSSVDEWWQSYTAEFETVFSAFTLESTESTVLDGTAAQKYVYTGVLGENTYRYTQFAAVRGGVVYVITFTELASGEEPVDHSTDISDIVTNFRWAE